MVHFEQTERKDSDTDLWDGADDDISDDSSIGYESEEDTTSTCTL